MLSSISNVSFGCVDRCSRRPTNRNVCLQFVHMRVAPSMTRFVTRVTSGSRRPVSSNLEKNSVYKSLIKYSLVVRRIIITTFYYKCGRFRSPKFDWLRGRPSLQFAASICASCTGFHFSISSFFSFRRLLDDYLTVRFWPLIRNDKKEEKNLS